MSASTGVWKKWIQSSLMTSVVWTLAEVSEDEKGLTMERSRHRGPPKDGVKLHSLMVKFQRTRSCLLQGAKKE